MISPRFYFIIFLLHSCTYICRSTSTIPGVTRLCRNPEGRLGRCTSMARCHRLVGCDRKASIWPCSNGHGSPPHVCCIFGKRIVFPDNDYDAYAHTSTSASAAIPNLTALQSRNRSVLSSEENGNDFVITTTTTPAPESSKRVVNKWSTHKNKWDLFPKTGECGPMLLGGLIHGGVEAELGEFSWLVNLEYKSGNGPLAIGCAGSILNHRYVLTSGHCVTGPIVQTIGKLESLRAGDHNVITKYDCKNEECIGPFQRYGIIEKMVHENFVMTPNGKIYHDIALVKTDKPIIYLSYVAPVCLPAVMPSLPPPTNGTRMTVAGWGLSETANYTDTKHIVDIMCVDDVKCRFNDDLARLCAGGELGKDSCEGDSGGSLARRTAEGWVIEGIVSYGIGKGCGNEKPAVYARVRNFLQWIQDHVDEP